MIAGRRVLAIVPARGGSKGLPRKNLRLFGGVPLVGLVGRVISELREIDRSVVSTDSEDIARVAEAAGISAPFRRPAELSGDLVGDVDVLTHALRTMETLDGVEYQVVVMLQPTSPLRTAAHVHKCIETLSSGAWDAVWTVSETEPRHHPLKQLTIAGNGQLALYDPGGRAIIARQQLPPVFHRNGIAYALTRDCLLAQQTLLGTRTVAIVVPGPHLSIDTEEDLRVAEFLSTGLGN